MRFAFISVIGEHHPRRLSNFATTVFVIKASFPCVETPCSATVSSAWLVACAAFVEGVSCFIFSYMPITSPPPGYYACFFSLIPITSPLAGYYACFFSLIPTISPLSGYYASFFLPHTHYLSTVWVLCLLFLSHTHYLSIAWVLRFIFSSHTYYLSPVWVLRLLFLSHTHYNYLVTNHLRIRARKSSQKISVAFVDGVGWYICAFYCAISQKKGAELMLDSLKFKSIR